MSNYIMVIDTETIGLPIYKSYGNYHNPKDSKYYDNARMIELGYILYSATGEKIKVVSSLINLDIDINNTHIHGITRLECKERGENIEKVINTFYNDLKLVSSIVAHNIMFDYHIILSELYRINRTDVIKEINNKILLCTMKIGQDKLKLTKRPKLVELYYILFSEKLEQQHRALSDCESCASCYFRLNSLES